MRRYDNEMIHIHTLIVKSTIDDCINLGVSFNIILLLFLFLLFFVAVKCNDSPAVLQTLAALGTGFDCASKAEIAKVLNFGVAPQSIIFANPTKSIAHLRYATEMNVTAMTVDCDFELQKIAKYTPNAR